MSVSSRRYATNRQLILVVINQISLEYTSIIANIC